MDPLTVVTGATALVGLGMGWRWRHRAHRAEAEAGRLRADLRAERHAARHDPLTGLPNRRAFHQIGAALLADPTRAHVVAAVLDLDGFKQVNDRYGHAVGDEVLITIARRFATFAGPDLVARLGGDEFAGLLHCSRIDERSLQETGRRLAAILAGPVPVTGGTVVVTSSVGLTPVNATSDLDELLRRADEAMYRAKARPDRAACHLPGPVREPARRAGHRDLRFDRIDRIDQHSAGAPADAEPPAVGAPVPAGTDRALLAAGRLDNHDPQWPEAW